MNAVEIEAAISELAPQPFDRQEFPFAFLAAFGNKDTTLKRLRTGNSNASDVPGGVLQRNHIHLAVCAPGTVGATLGILRGITTRCWSASISGAASKTTPSDWRSCLICTPK